MKSEFCTSCGNKVEYNFAPPNFCSKCGTPMGGGAPRQEVAQAQVTEAPVAEDRVPQLSKLEYDVNYEGASSRTLKFEELAMQKVDTDEASIKNRKGRRGTKKKAPQLTREEFLVKSVQECKSIGNSSHEIGGEKRRK